MWRISPRSTRHSDDRCLRYDLAHSPPYAERLDFFPSTARFAESLMVLLCHAGLFKERFTEKYMFIDDFRLHFQKHTLVELDIRF